MQKLTEEFVKRYPLEGYTLQPVEAHEGGRNYAVVCKQSDEPRYVLRISATGDRDEGSYLAEAEFVHYLAENGAPVADVIPSLHGNLTERAEWEGKTVFASLFAYAKGMLISDNGYRYRDGAPLSEYFYRTGKALGCIHRLAKQYHPETRRPDYFEKYNMAYLDSLLPAEHPELKAAIAARLADFKALPQTKENYGLVHFDFSDGNYHIDMETGDITVFDFDNCMRCWYLFDLANLWTHGVGWIAWENDREKRRAFMERYFETIVEGYRSETALAEEELARLPLLIDMVLIENIVDECECRLRAGEPLDYEDIEESAECLVKHIPYANFC